jgi:hypothetical protein
MWFKFWGIKIDMVINQELHIERMAHTKYLSYSKAPKLFGIDLLVDDLPGVKIECSSQGCNALVLNSEDSDWPLSVSLSSSISMKHHTRRSFRNWKG